MKQGDKVICIKNFTSFKVESFKVRKGEVFNVVRVMTDHDGLNIEIDAIKGWWVWGDGIFRKVENRTNTLSKELAEEFIEQDNKREQEIERVFTTKASF